MDISLFLNAWKCSLAMDLTFHHVHLISFR